MTRRLPILLLCGLHSALTAACQTAPEAVDPPGFAVSTDIEAPLNAAIRQPAGPGPVVIDADSPFQLHLPAQAGRAPQRFSLQYRRNDGPWRPVEAQGFPLPERERVIDFADAANGAPAPAVRAAAGVEMSVQDGVLLIGGAGADRYVFIDSPWPLDVFSFAADLTLPQSGRAALVFGYRSPGDHARLVMDPAAGEMRMERVLDGRTRILGRTAAPLAAGARVSVEVQNEGGVLDAEIGKGAAVLSAPLPPGLPAETLGFHLAGGVAAIHSIELAGEADTPPVSIVESPVFEHGAVTEPVLAGGASALSVSLQDATPVWRAAPGAVADFVWPLVIRRFADRAVLNEAGDRFAFRMVDAAGERANLGADPVITLRVPEGHLGGTFVETPGRIGPFRSDSGALYFIMEPAETDNLFMMVRSEDGGRTWREVDSAGRPATGDLEAVDARMIDGTIHILHQITDHVVLHTFNTADHRDRPDQWTVTDAPVADIEAMSQMATLAARPDGALTAVFLGDQLYVTTRPAEGDWSDIAVLDPEADALTVGPQAISGADGAVYVAYADAAGTVWLRTLVSQGSIDARRPITVGAVTGEEDYGAVLPLVYMEATQTLTIAYRLADGTVWERRLSGGDLSAPARIAAGPVITNAVDSQQAAADIAAHGDTLHALFVDADTRSIYSVHDCGAGWSEPVLRVDDIVGSWVRGAIHDGGEGPALYRYVYDAGSNGGSGLNRYGEIALTMCE